MNLQSALSIPTIIGTGLSSNYINSKGKILTNGCIQEKGFIKYFMHKYTQKESKWWFLLIKTIDRSTSIVIEIYISYFIVNFFNNILNPLIFYNNYPFYIKLLIIKIQI